MSNRKLKVSGVTQEVSLDKSKKYKYDKAGALVEATTFTDNDIVFAGSKSSLRRIADLERNVSILASKLTTTDGASTDSDDDSYDNIVAEDARFRAAVRIDGTATFNSSMVFGSTAKANMLAALKDVDGTGSGLNADLLDGQSIAYFATAASVTSEASARSSADTTLQNNINAEATARASGDTSTLSSANSYTDTKITALTNGASAAFDTLKEIQDAMATDAELSAAISAITTVANANKWTTARTLSLAGDASGSVSIDGSGNVTLTASVPTKSHNHSIAQVTGLQAALDALAARCTALEAKLSLVTSVTGGIRVAGTVTATGDITAFGA